MHPARAGLRAPCRVRVEAPLGSGSAPSLRALPAELCRPAGLTPPPLPYPVLGRNAAGKDGRERLGGSVLEQIPFLQHCEDDDSDEDDELDGAQHRKQRVKVSAPPRPGGAP